MKTFRLVIWCEGAAFEDDESREAEIARLLRLVADKFRRPAGTLSDSNGNRCGEWSFADEQEGGK